MFWERVVTSFDLLVGGLDFWGFKWRLADKLSVNDDSHRPDVDLIRMSLSLQNFWSDIVGRAANGLLLFLVELQPSSQSEVTKFDFHVLVQKEISEFQISVDDLVLVEIDEGVYYLQLIVLHFHFGKSLPPFDQLV